MRSTKTYVVELGPLVARDGQATVLLQPERRFSVRGVDATVQTMGFDDYLVIKDQAGSTVFIVSTNTLRYCRIKRFKHDTNNIKVLTE